MKIICRHQLYRKRSCLKIVSRMCLCASVKCRYHQLSWPISSSISHYVLLKPKNIGWFSPTKVSCGVTPHETFVGENQPIINNPIRSSWFYIMFNHNVFLDVVPQIRSSNFEQMNIYTHRLLWNLTIHPYYTCGICIVWNALIERPHHVKIKRDGIGLSSFFTETGCMHIY